MCVIVDDCSYECSYSLEISKFYVIFKNEINF